eukprot:6091989-Pleurochrysis_carterae.AAC.4
MRARARMYAPCAVVRRVRARLEKRGGRADAARWRRRERGRGRAVDGQLRLPRARGVDGGLRAHALLGGRGELAVLDVPLFRLRRRYRLGRRHDGRSRHRPVGRTVDGGGAVARKGGGVVVVGLTLALSVHIVAERGRERVQRHRGFDRVVGGVGLQPLVLERLSGRGTRRGIDAEQRLDKLPRLDATLDRYRPCRLALADKTHERAHVARVERQRRREHRKEDDAHRPHVRLGAIVLALVLHQLGRGVERRAAVRLEQPNRLERRKPKIGNLDHQRAARVLAVGQHQVLELQVAVVDPERMAKGEAFEELAQEVARLLVGEAALLVKKGEQVAVGAVLHHEVVALRRLDPRVEAYDVRVPQQRVVGNLALQEELSTFLETVAFDDLDGHLRARARGKAVDTCQKGAEGQHRRVLRAPFGY